MNTRTSRAVGMLAIGALAAGGALAASGAGAADHLDAPRVQKDGRTDINDIYAFQSPTNADNTVLIMTVNPGAGVISGTTFDPNGQYNFQIDDDGDAKPDHQVIVRFAPGGGDGQRYSVFVDGDNVSTGMVGETSEIAGGGTATAGVFDDPFFFDLEGFQNGFAFTGADFFAGLNVSAIVLEMPLADVTGENNVGIWGTTDKGNTQADRMGRPAINTVLIPSSKKNQFNRSAPDRDPGLYGDDVRAAITGLSGDADYAAAVTSILLPDVLTVDLSNPAGFLNGRGLTDDVIDAELGILSNGAVTTDGVDANDVPFPGAFPYLAPAN